MKRGRKPTPSALKLVKNNPGRRPLNKNEPQADGKIGAPPNDWPALGRRLWYELRKQIPEGVATASDRAAFELLVRLFAHVRASPENLTPSLAAQIRCLLGEFGCTPSSRTTLSVPAPRKSDDLAAEYFDDLPPL